MANPKIRDLTTSDIIDRCGDEMTEGEADRMRSIVECSEYENTPTIDIPDSEWMRMLDDAIGPND